MAPVAAGQLTLLGRQLQRPVSDYSRYSLCENKEQGLLRFHHIRLHQCGHLPSLVQIWHLEEQITLLKDSLKFELNGVNYTFIFVVVTNGC